MGYFVLGKLVYNTVDIRRQVRVEKVNSMRPKQELVFRR
jgi:hypothetical protein